MVGELNIFEEDFWAISKALKRLLDTSNSKCVILMDKAGQVISSIGDTGWFDLNTLSTLIAANMAAFNEIAQSLGEKEFSTIQQQGQNINLYVKGIEDKVILAVLYDSKVSFNLVKARVKYAAEEISQIMKRIFAKLEGEKKPAEIIDEDFAKEAEDELDKLFGG